MTIFTHITVAGIVAATFNCSYEGMGLMMAGSLLPDIDNPNSVVGKLLFFVSKKINQFFDHRKLIHSILLWVFLYVISLFVFPRFSLLFIGAITHILIDCFSIKGVQIFQPFSEVVAVIFPKQYRISVGSKSEFVILFFLLILFSGVFYVNKKGGFVAILTEFIGSYETALKHYEQVGTQICKIKGKLRFKSGIIEEKEWLIVGVEHGNGLALFDEKNKQMIHLPKDGFFLKCNLIKTTDTWKIVSVNKPSVIRTDECFFMFDNRWIYSEKGGLIQGEILYRKNLKIK